MYSFGILLLEIFTGKRPTDGMFHDELTLHEFSKKAISGSGVAEMVDHLVYLVQDIGINNDFERFDGERQGSIEACLPDVLRLGVICSMESPAERTEMTDVVLKLHSIREKFLCRRAD